MANNSVQHRYLWNNDDVDIVATSTRYLHVVYNWDNWFAPCSLCDNDAVGLD